MPKVLLTIQGVADRGGAGRGGRIRDGGHAAAQRRTATWIEYDESALTGIEGVNNAPYA